MNVVLPMLVALMLAWPAAAAAAPADADPRIQHLLAAVSPARLEQLLARLTAFGTRETLSDGAPATRGIAAAAEWIAAEMKRPSAKLQVSFDTHVITAAARISRTTTLRNVMAVLPGRSPRRVYISGHYDSLNLGPGVQIALTAAAPGARAENPQSQPQFDHDADAPGANDDGSGTVLTMELARVFAESGLDFDATLVFVCWAGEEQGLIGSTAHVRELAADGVVVEAALDSDIVGNVHGGDGRVDGTGVRVYSVGPEDSPSRALARYVRAAAAIYVPSHRVRLMAREDRFGRGSDHSAFTQSGYPAVVFREAAENFARQHTAADTLAGVDVGYLAQNTRVNAAAAAALALPPPVPKITGEKGAPLISRDPSGYDASLRWTASPGAAGYRIYWRDTWTNDWQHRQDVGNVTHFVLPGVSIDDFVFGVAAVGADGQESLVASYEAGVRKPAAVTPVK